MEKLIILFALLSTFSQLFWIIYGRVRAPRASWIIWFLIGVMQFTVNYGFNGLDQTSIMLGAYSFGNLFIVAYILFKNPSGWTSRETKILIATLCIILCWLPFKLIAEKNSLLWATIISQLLLNGAHFIGVWNHWIKVWSDPFTEAWDSWIMRLISLILTLSSLLCQFPLNDVTLYSKVIPPLYGCITVGFLLILIATRRIKLKR
jgi:hypothetical protein